MAQVGFELMTHDLNFVKFTLKPLLSYLKLKNDRLTLTWNFDGYGCEKELTERDLGDTSK